MRPQGRRISGQRRDRGCAACRQVQIASASGGPISVLGVVYRLFPPCIRKVSKEHNLARAGELLQGRGNYTVWLRQHPLEGMAAEQHVGFSGSTFDESTLRKTSAVSTTPGSAYLVKCLGRYF